jgi:methylmalonyl-CoA/ethylmalonyl-CoA epimerase
MNQETTSVQQPSEALAAESPRKVFDAARLYHIAIMVKSVAETAKFYEDAFGIGPFEFREVNFATATYRGGKGGYRGKRAYAQLGPVQLELMEHIEGKTIQEDFLRDKGEGLHHLGFEVNNLRESIEEAQRRGVAVSQGFTRDDGSGFAYLESDRIGGAIFEVVEKMRPKA